jgi:regulator of replication initiation timing
MMTLEQEILKSNPNDFSVVYKNTRKKIDEINSIGLLSGYLTESDEVLKICEENDIKQSDVVVYSAFRHLLTHPKISMNDAKDIFSVICRIPKKKEKKFFDRKVMEWVATQAAKKFYQPLRNLNYEISSDLNPSYKISEYYIFRIIDLFVSNLDIKQDPDLNRKIIEEYIKRNDYPNLIGHFCVAAILDDRLLDEFIQIINEKKLCKIFSYHLTNTIMVGAHYLIRHGKGEVLINVSEEFMTMTNEVIEESTEKTKTEVQSYMEEIEDLQKKIDAVNSDLKFFEEENARLILENASLRNKMILKNKKVLVIGDRGRMSHYRDLVEMYGGEFSFIDGIEESMRSRTSVLRSDLVFYFTAHAKHKTEFPIKNIESVKIIKVEKTGMASLERAILNLCKS